MKDSGLARVWSVFYLYEPNSAGSAIQGRKILERLVAKAADEFEVRILAAADFLAKNLKGRTIRKHGLRVQYLPVITRKAWGFFRMRAARKIVRYINALLSTLSFGLAVSWTIFKDGDRGDIVHFHSINTFSFLVAWIAKLRGMHIVVLLTLLGSDDPYSIMQNRDPLRRLKVIVFDHADAIITLTSAQTESCRRTGISLEKVHRIPCAVDTQKLKPIDSASKCALRGDLGLKQNRKYVLFVGGALWRKGIDVLIEAFTKVARKRNEVDLLLVGPNDFRDNERHPPERQMLLQRLRGALSDEGLAERVHWIGRIDDPSPYYQVSDVFCFPTRREGFGIVIAEAMVAGLPVVVAALDGVTTDHFESPDQGILISNHNPEDYADVLLRLLEESDKMAQMGRAARDRARRLFALQVIVDQFIDLYGELLVSDADSTG